ncbi:oxidoreductase [Nannocystis bainbridge]|uniref:NADH:flavin oxidoreductase n=1 Tax=Nannocystis bainbridge TaxID=2995303 RepID=A0ABT5E2T8_9BACT|nr:NADH:flavin oxidoreductase [Nannocystis bainbridge]MDC0720194.1 NADH:flavin oxidoreductase [Nannocystis bainbridge]
MWTPPAKIRHAIPPARWPSAAEAAASRWFSPIDVGPCRLHARTWVPAMVPWRASDDGRVTPDVIAWYARFAAGEPGALVVEATGIRDVPSGPLLRIGDDRFVAGLADLVAAVREASGGRTRLFIQLIDFLAVKRRPAPDKFFARFLRVDAGHRERLAAALADDRWLAAPEAELRAFLLAAETGLLEQVLTDRERRELEFGYRELVTDLDLPHVRDLPRVLPELFAAAAARAEAAGFDGVELHYAHAYTMASFLSRTNTRADGYGGTLAGRARLPLEVLAAVRARVGAGTAVGCRMLGDEVIAGGSDLADAVQFARDFAAAGMDFVSVSKGGKFDDAHPPKVGEAVYPYTGPSGYECMPTVHSDARGPFARNVPLAAAIRAAIRADGRITPVVAAGGIHEFGQAEAILAAGDADIVAAARQSLADPDWFLKVREGRGAEVRRCKFTNYCEALDTQHKQVTCQLWDRVELDEPGLTRSHDGKRRLVAPTWRR